MLDFDIKLIEAKLMAETMHSLRSESGFNCIRQESYELLTQTPECLRQYIYEWLWDLPFSDIEYHGLTFNDFLKKIKFAEQDDNIHHIYTFWCVFERYMFYAEEGQREDILEKVFPWMRKCQTI